MEKRIYLNNAATSWPKPPCVAGAVRRALTELPGSAHRGGIDARDVFDETRRALAAVLGVTRPERIALGANATWGLNAAIGGFPLRPGDAVLATGAEHNSVLRPLRRLEQGGVRVICLPTDGWGRVAEEDWTKALREHRPALCVFTHASNVTGAVNDAPALAALAHEFGAAVLIDASQTLGWAEVRSEDWGADLVAFTGHKYLLGPQGTGGLYVRPGLELTPVLTGGTGIRSDLDAMPEEMPVHLEAGTGNEPSCAGLLSALRWQEEHPRDRISCRGRADRLKRLLAMAGAAVIDPPGECTPVVSFTVPGHPPDAVGYILAEGYGIVCRSGLHCAPRIFRDLGVPGTVRLSLSRFTTDGEVDAAAEAVRDILAGHGG